MEMTTFHQNKVSSFRWVLLSWGNVADEGEKVFSVAADGVIKTQVSDWVGWETLCLTSLSKI